MINMKKTAILIGFYYDHPGWKSLCGALIDLYHAWEHCNGLGYEVRIINDFLEESIPDSINSAVLNGYVDVDVLDFCETQRENMCNVLSKTEFTKALKSALEEVGDVLFIYFSGHGDEERDGLVLPDDSLLEWNIFYKILLSHVPMDTEVCLVFDCCYPPDFNLSYTLCEKRFRLLHPYAIPPLHQIQVFTSSHPSQRSESSDRGSLFTRFFFQQLKEIFSNKSSSLNLVDFKDNIDEKIRNKRGKKAQKIYIYSSHSHLPLLKWWLWNTKHVEYLLSKKVFQIEN